MEIESIKGDIATLIYHPGEIEADVGANLSLLQTDGQGLIVQVIANETLSYEGLQAELLQRVLEERLADTRIVLDRERGMDALRTLKVARAKIRKRVRGGDSDNSNGAAWETWGGWIPTRGVRITPVPASELMARILPAARNPLGGVLRLGDIAADLEGERLDKVVVIAGHKGTGKSHVAKLIALALARRRVPVCVCDPNGEYGALPGAQVVRWSHGHRFSLSELGHGALIKAIQWLYPFQSDSSSESVFRIGLAQAYRKRRERCEQEGAPFTFDLNFLREQKWSGGSFVVGAIQERLSLIAEMNLFEEETTPPQQQQPQRRRSPHFADLYEAACEGRPLVFDMTDLSDRLSGALAEIVIGALRRRCDEEHAAGTARYPYLCLDEAHLYVREAGVLDLITRGRHIGISSLFITNSPQMLPEPVYRQLDNLLLLGLTHEADIRAVSRTAYLDAASAECFALRLPRHHALVCGRVTGGYPAVMAVEPLPAGMPASGRTRSTWSRFDAPPAAAG